MTIHPLDARQQLKAAIRNAKESGASKVPVHIYTLQRLVDEYEVLEKKLGHATQFEIDAAKFKRDRLEIAG